MRNPFKSIIASLLGHKYYAVILNTRGCNDCMLTSYIFHNREEVQLYIDSLKDNRSYQHLQTIVFRSNLRFPDLYAEYLKKKEQLAEFREATATDQQGLPHP